MSAPPTVNISDQLLELAERLRDAERVGGLGTEPPHPARPQSSVEPIVRRPEGQGETSGKP